MDIFNEFTKVTVEIQSFIQKYHPNAFIDSSNIVVHFKKKLSETDDFREWAKYCYGYLKDNLRPYENDKDPRFIQDYVGEEMIKYYAKVEYKRVKPKVDNIKDLLKDIRNFLDNYKDHLTPVEIAGIEDTINEYLAKVGEKDKYLMYIASIFTPSPTRSSKGIPPKSKPIPKHSNKIPNRDKRIPSNKDFLELRNKIFNLRAQYYTI